ncbi:MAG: hypothetical protein ACTHKZ_11585 [Lysobacteraceae bacterium]
MASNNRSDNSGGKRSQGSSQGSSRGSGGKQASSGGGARSQGGGMSVREAGHKGGQRVSELVAKGKQNGG